MYKEAFSSIVFLFNETSKKIVSDNKSHFRLYALAFPKVVESIERIIE